MSFEVIVGNHRKTILITILVLLQLQTLDNSSPKIPASVGMTDKLETV